MLITSTAAYFASLMHDYAHMAVHVCMPCLFNFHSTACMRDTVRASWPARSDLGCMVAVGAGEWG